MSNDMICVQQQSCWAARSLRPSTGLVLAYARPFVLLSAFFAAACTPTVQVQAPDKPIEINMNINIEHRIKVEIEKDVKQAITTNPDIF